MIRDPARYADGQNMWWELVAYGTQDDHPCGQFPIIREQFVRVRALFDYGDDQWFADSSASGGGGRGLRDGPRPCEATKIRGAEKPGHPGRRCCGVPAPRALQLSGRPLAWLCGASAPMSSWRCAEDAAYVVQMMVGVVSVVPRDVLRSLRATSRMLQCEADRQCLVHCLGPRARRPRQGPERR
jgi:hypothetical protein